MGGSATLGSNLVDSLVTDVVDALRSDLNSDMGTRQFRVYLCTRTWDGGERGLGTGTISATEITPPPLVEETKADALRFAMMGTGKNEEGNLVLREVSLSYTHAELVGASLGANKDFYYRVVDGLGQGIPTRYYVPAEPPFPDRIKDIGWRIMLKRAEVQE